MTQTGRIVFGPNATHPMQARWRDLIAQTQSMLVSTVQPCNCIGPQPGQTKCPCALRAEMQQAEQMLRDGVTINGRRYRLVEDAP